MQEVIRDYFNQHGRDMPWRHPDSDGNFDPYKILVSEIMLQQTQVSRVIPKYLEFIQQFPTNQTLAKAPLASVLKAWSGLGYNRRAQYLHKAVQKIGLGKFPTSLEGLRALPGVGPNTAAAVLVYAYNQPYPFIETNIRTVYIHHYFPDQIEPVDDKQLMPLISETLDREHPREWFWALMDYGAYLKSTVGNLSRSSKHYAKQSTFQGSRRQIRGQIIKMLNHSPRNYQNLAIEITDDRLESVLRDLVHEKLVVKANDKYSLPS